MRFFRDLDVDQVFLDSRKSFSGPGSVFVAFKGSGQDGHRFLVPLYEKGVRQFVVTDAAAFDIEQLPEANILLVTSPVLFLQRLARWRRDQFSVPVIGITGSNGKTIVKEWLHEVLSPEHSVIKSPGSYNSQIGVPLSVWPMHAGHTIGIFEAGISRAGEMDALEQVIRPTIGVFTNLLAAHDEGFGSREEKAREKSRLFREAERVVYCADDPIVAAAVVGLSGFSWGRGEENPVRIVSDGGTLRVSHAGEEFPVETRFTDPASLQNASHVICVMILLGYPSALITERVGRLRRLPMRLEMKEGLNGCIIIDDTYSNDLSSLKLALDFMRAQQPHRTHGGTLVLSDLEQTGLEDPVWVDEVRRLLSSSPVSELVGIGPVMQQKAAWIGHQVAWSGFPDTESFLRSGLMDKWQNRIVLVKGARSFRLEQVVEMLLRRSHGTVMEVDLLALARNLNVFRSALKAGTRLMVMVKAFAYGSGAGEVARMLQHHGVDYLGVAYTDEGVALRQQGIDLPIMVMNPTPESAGILAAHRLEPALFSRQMAERLVDRLRGSSVSIHVKIDTGMNRLGFKPSETGWLTGFLSQNRHLPVASVYSHLAGSESESLDAFTRTQAARFDAVCRELQEVLGYKPLRHILNTSGILRHPELQLDMARLGIGLYGAAPTKGLDQVLTLKTVLSQVKVVGEGETVGYGRHGQVAPGTRIGTVSIGYADGYSRAFSRGVGKMLVHGRRAPVVGNVCMDMTMIDLTGIDAQEGDEVIVYGRDLPPTELASWIGTIPYEILTATGERVRRVFHSAG